MRDGNITTLYQTKQGIFHDRMIPKLYQPLGPYQLTDIHQLSLGHCFGGQMDMLPSKYIKVSYSRPKSAKKSFCV